jgi:hypothetical protein
MDLLNASASARLLRSYEALFHNASAKRFLLDLRDQRLQYLREPRLERALGVVYRPESERISHYLRPIYRRSSARSYTLIRPERWSRCSQQSTGKKIKKLRRLSHPGSNREPGTMANLPRLDKISLDTGYEWTEHEQ